MDQSLRRNIPALYIIKICKWFMLYMPVVKLFYEENNLHDFDLFLLHGIYSVIIALLEIPSGYIADVWGRKFAIITGLAFGLVGFFTYSISFGFWGFLLAEVALGIGQGFISGSDTALLFDTLKQNHRQRTYAKYEGRITASGNLAEAMAGITVTLLAFETMRGYYKLQTILIFIAFLTGWFLQEPTYHKSNKPASFKAIMDIVQYTLFKNRILSRYVIFSSIVGVASLTMAWFAQIFLYEAGVKKAHFGIVWTTLNLMVAAGSFVAFRVSRITGPKIALGAILVFLSGGYMLTSQTITLYGVSFLFLFYFIRGTAHPILKERINRNTRSEVRATVMSIRSMMIRIMFAAGGPLLGLMRDNIGLEAALLTTGFAIIIPGSIIYLNIARGKR
ncbi:MAG: MFS transporter [Bacteroidales bacterium]|nr:MFS transporter [Bacteroidales bacterium]